MFTSLSPQVYLSKESFARARRAVHEDIPVQAVVLPRVSCCYGDVTYTLFQGRLRDKRMHLYEVVTLEMHVGYILCKDWYVHLHSAQLPRGHPEVCSSAV